MAENKKEIEKDIEYLEKEFPKGQTKFRGQAMVLLTLARIQGSLSEEKEVLKLIDDVYYTPKLDHKRVPEITIFIKELRKRLLKLRKKE
jgi:hypothetical protein